MYNKINLPYAFDALEPYIDEETVKTHYGKHLQTYETNLNKALEGYEEYTKGKTLDQLIKDIEDLPEEIRPAVVNNGGGVSNHNLYFSVLSPTPKKAPEGKLLEEINKITEVFSISLTDFIRNAVEKEVKEIKKDFFYKLSQVDYCSNEESKEIIEELNKMTEDDLKVTKIKSITLKK